MPWASMPRALISSDQPQGSTVSTGKTAIPERKGSCAGFVDLTSKKSTAGRDPCPLYNRMVRYVTNVIM